MKRVDPEIKSCWVDQVEIGFGQRMYVCFSRRYPGPVGFVWGIALSDGRRHRFEVLGSYTIPVARRFGVRTRINAAILLEFHCVTTPSGSAKGGFHFMQSRGYEHDPRRVLWSKIRKRETP